MSLVSFELFPTTQNQFSNNRPLPKIDDFIKSNINRQDKSYNSYF